MHSDFLHDGDRFAFTHPGPPQTWKRKGGYGNRSFNPSLHAQKQIAWSVKACCPELRCDDVHLWSVSLVFYSSSPHHLDVDNLVKNVLDALQQGGIAWANDTQVREIYGLIMPCKPGMEQTRGVLRIISWDEIAEKVR
jgi:Holliday junction resolvase RusA-like endonuclease